MIRVHLRSPAWRSWQLHRSIKSVKIVIVAQWSKWDRPTDRPTCSSSCSRPQSFLDCHVLRRPGRASPMRKTWHVWKLSWAVQFVPVTVQLRVQHYSTTTVCSIGLPTTRGTCCELVSQRHVLTSQISEPAGTTSLFHFVLLPFSTETIYTECYARAWTIVTLH